jgi:hypothetical protein
VIAASASPSRLLRALAALGLVLLSACAAPLPGADSRLPGAAVAAGDSGDGTSSPPGSNRGRLSFQVTGTEFRPEPHPEDAAVRYDVRITNTGGSEVRVDMDLDGLRARDDLGGEYVDYWSHAERNNQACSCPGCRMPDFSRLTRLTMSLPPGGYRDAILYLSRADARGDCQRSGRARSRIAPGTTRIDVVLPEATTLNADGSPAGTVPGTTLRLEREP